MAKEDVPPLPDEVPRKRKQIEKLLDVHIAMWLAKDDLSPGDRKRLQEEKDRRKKRNPDYHIGFFGSRTGMTPEQKLEVLIQLESFAVDVDKFTAHYLIDVRGGSAQNFHRIVKKVHHQGYYNVMVDIQLYPDIEGSMQEIIKASTHLIVTPKEAGEIREECVARAISYAKAREVPILLVDTGGDTTHS